LLLASLNYLKVNNACGRHLKLIPLRDPFCDRQQHDDKQGDYYEYENGF
jgi:hypothetical protein